MAELNVVLAEIPSRCCMTGEVMSFSSVKPDARVI